jgi:hypothetical protein
MAKPDDDPMAVVRDHENRVEAILIAPDEDLDGMPLEEEEASEEEDEDDEEEEDDDG